MVFQNPGRRMMHLHCISLILNLMILVRLETVTSIGIIEDGSSSALVDNDFQMTSKVRLYDSRLVKVATEVSVDEFYSAQSRKARIEVYEQIFEQPSSLAASTYGYRTDKANYYFDAKAGTMIRSTKNAIPNDCKSVQGQQLAQDLFGDHFKQIKLLNDIDWLPKVGQVSDHVVGLARFLLIIENNKDKLVADSKLTTFIRNHKVTKYSADIDLGSGVETRVSAYFSKILNANQNSESNLGTPIRFWCDLSDGFELVVDLFYIGPIRNELHLSEGATRALNQVDLFTFPLGIGCSELMKPTFGDTWQTSAFFLNEQKVLSFRMELNEIIELEMPRFMMHSFVAYDGYAGAMRRDMIRLRNNYATQKDQMLDYTIVIYDLQARRKFHIERPTVGSSPGSWNTMRTFEDSGGRSSVSYCIASVATNQFSRNSDQLNPIIPFNELVEMGSAIVRGIKTRIFEHISPCLPEFIFEHATIRDSNGDFVNKMELGEHLKEVQGSSGRAANNYVITYFIFFKDSSGQALESFEEGLPKLDKNFITSAQLMRVDINWNQIVFVRADIHEFIWQLTDAPNGDKHDDLFSLQSYCPASDRGQPVPVVTMDLVLRHGDPQNGLKTSDIDQLIRVPAIRNKALVRALSCSWRAVTASEIHNVRSRLHYEPRVHSNSGGPEEVVRIVASLQLMVHSKPKLYNPVSVGRGYYVEDQSQLLLEANQLSECLREAARLQSHSSNLILVSYCKGFCIVDSEPRLEFSLVDGKTNSLGKAKLLESKVFRLNPSYVCEIIYFDISFDLPINPAAVEAKSWANIYHNLHNSLLTLPLIDIDTQKSLKHVENLIFKVEHLELTNEHLRRKADSGPSKQTSNELDVNKPLDGLGLVVDSASNSRPLVQEAEILAQSSHNNFGSTTQMDVGLCHESCIVDLDCRSYSVCFAKDKFQCHISRVDFRDPKLLQQISKKRGSMDSSFELDVDTNTADLEIDDEVAQDASKPSTSTSIKLKLDKRCRIYHRHALELFRQLPRSSQLVIDRNLLAVTDLEECASICLRKNVEFFKKASKRVEKSNADRQSRETDWHRQLMKDMRRWCSLFKYLNLKQASLSYRLMGQIGLDKTFKGGLCWLARPKWAQRTKSQSSSTLTAERPSDQMADTKAPRATIRMDNFEFVYRKLFTRRAGLRLIGQMQEAKASKNVALDPLMNQQVLESTNNHETCARNCFAQLTGLRPWCRSFDVMESASSKNSFYCIYNSMTLNEATKVNQVETIDQTNVDGVTETFWHFEPRISFTLDDAFLGSLIDPPDLLGDNFRDNFRFNNWSTVTSRFLVVLAAIASGLVASNIVVEIFLRAIRVPSMTEPRWSISMNGLLRRDQLEEVHQANV